MTGPRRLVLLRHGRTDWNASHRIQGQQDSQLDDVGLAQARTVAPAVAAMSPSLLWSSDLARAHRTAEEVAAATGLPLRTDARLREFSLGEYERLTHDELRAQDPAGFERFRRGAWEGIPGAEHPREVAERMVAVLTELAGAMDDGATGVAVSHGAAIRTGLVAFLGWPLETARTLRGMGNCGRVVLEQRDGGDWALTSYNLPPDFTSPTAVG